MTKTCHPGHSPGQACPTPTRAAETLFPVSGELLYTYRFGSGQTWFCINTETQRRGGQPPSSLSPGCRSPGDAS